MRDTPIIDTSTTQTEIKKMTDSQKIQKELDEMNSKRKQVITENTVKCDQPKCDRGYTYRPPTEF